MARFSVNYPDGYKDIITAARRKALGTDARGLTDGKVIDVAFGQYVKPYVKAYQRQNVVGVSDTVTAKERALADKQQALLDAEDARKVAEGAQDAQVETDFEGFS